MTQVEGLGGAVNRTGVQGKRALCRRAAWATEIEMNQEYFGNWKAFRENVKSAGANRSCVAAFVPFLKTKVPVNHRSNAK